MSAQFAALLPKKKKKRKTTNNKQGQAWEVYGVHALCRCSILQEAPQVQFSAGSANPALSGADGNSTE